METASLLKDLEYHEIKPMIKVLFETSFTKEIRIAMKAGTEMKKHKTSFPIVVQLVEGTLDFGVNDSVLALEKGERRGFSPQVKCPIVFQDAVEQAVLVQK